jgi:hypothetical protein
MEKPKRQYFNKRKYNKHGKGHFINYNIEEYQNDASGKKEDFIDMSSNLGKNHKNKYESIASEESEPIKRYYNTDKKIIENIEL